MSELTKQKGNKYSVSAKVTSKGQVTIPVIVRNTLKLKKGDQVAFEVVGNTVSVRKLTAIDRIAKAIGPKLLEEFPTPEDFDAYLRENRKELFNKIYGAYDIESGD